MYRVRKNVETPIRMLTEKPSVGSDISFGNNISFGCKFLGKQVKISVIVIISLAIYKKIIIILFKIIFFNETIKNTIPSSIPATFMASLGFIVYNQRITRADIHPIINFFIIIRPFS